MTIRELLTRRSELRDQMQTIDKAHADGALPEAEQRQWDALKSDLAGVEGQIERRALIDETDRRMRGSPISGQGDGRWAELMAGYSLARACLYNDRNVDAGREREASAEVAKRVGRAPRGIFIPPDVFRTPIEQRAGQIVGDDTLGGFLAPGAYRPDMYIDRLRAASILPRLGVTWMSDLLVPTTIPKLTGSGSVEWVGENEEPTESEAGFGAVTLTPRTAAATMSYSRRTLLGASPSIDALLRDDIARQTAEAIDAAAVNGDGIKKPLGILRWPGLPITALGADGGVVTVDKLIDLAAAPAIANASGAG